MKKISLVLVLTFIFIGCSGKVQTNKIPDDKKYSLPKNYKQLSDREQLLELEKVKYDEYARDFFKVQKNIQFFQNPLITWLVFLFASSILKYYVNYLFLALL